MESNEGRYLNITKNILIILWITLIIFNLEYIMGRSSIFEYVLIILMTIFHLIGLKDIKYLSQLNKLIQSILFIFYIFLIISTSTRDIRYRESNNKCRITMTDKIFIVDIEDEKLKYLERSELEYDGDRHFPTLYESFIIDIFGNENNKGYVLKSTLMENYSKPKDIK